MRSSPMRALSATESVTPPPKETPPEERPLPTHGGEYERTPDGDVPIAPPAEEG
jgi:hypothetical protein